jgi:hypothetical protein
VLEEAVDRGERIHKLVCRKVASAAASERQLLDLRQSTITRDLAHVPTLYKYKQRPCGFKAHTLRGYLEGGDVLSFCFSASQPH